MPEPDLARISEVATLLDHPELAYPSIQVTGTNGKTATARLAASIACGHGLSTGAFISPHVVSLNERISLCGTPISDQELAEEYERLLPYFQLVDARGARVTYFEALTALAFVWFADKPVGLGVFEVGMGGTWDATNLVRGDVAVICPIGLDHMRELGGTVEAIAAEKAGIVKPERTAVVREQRPEALAVIERRAAEVGAVLLLEDRDFGLAERTRAAGGQVLSISGLHARYDEVFAPLHGEHQARNAAAAVVACEVLLDRALDATAVRAALASAGIPGRLEVAALHPTVVLDGAHNPDAAAALVAAVLEAFIWDRLHLVIGMFDDKDVEAVASILAPIASEGAVYVSRTGSPRSAPAERVAAALLAGGAPGARVFGSVEEAVGAARSAAGPGDLILVTGSFYTVAEARPLFVDATVPPDRKRGIEA
jgi:dihydrofolate synthase / folylpolyglutamate synthase